MIKWRWSISCLICKVIVSLEWDKSWEILFELYTRQLHALDGRCYHHVRWVHPGARPPQGFWLFYPWPTRGVGSAPLEPLTISQPDFSFCTWLEFDIFFISRWFFKLSFFDCQEIDIWPLASSRKWESWSGLRDSSLSVRSTGGWNQKIVYHFCKCFITCIKCQRWKSLSLAS